jgi:hypothetical protein
MTTETQDRTLQHPIGADGLFVLRLHDGEARIRATDGELATIRAIDGSLLDGVDIETGDRSLSIQARRGPDFLGRGRRGRQSSELEIEVPVGATVVIEAASADITAHGLHGDQRYRSASGDLIIQDVSGTLAADTVSGDLHIVATGPATLTARTVSGDLTLRARSIGELRAATTSGDLSIAGRFDGSGPYTIETVSGDLVLEPANDIRLEVATITGDMSSDVGARREDDRGRRAYVMGRGGPTIAFRSTSGDVRLARSMPAGADDIGAPTAPVAPMAPVSPTVPTPPPAPPATPVDEADNEAWLTVLRDLERGEIDVAEAGRRLEALDGQERTDA